MRIVIVIALVIGATTAARAEPCQPDPTPGDVLRKQLGRELEIRQSCAFSDGGYVAFTWTKDGHETAQIARCDVKTCTVVASWADVRNCDDGMCDHFSAIDSLDIVRTLDVDGDHRDDALLDFATITGDQGRESHRLTFWLSKTRTLRELSQLEGVIDSVEASPTGVVVTTHDGFDGGPQSITCFDQAGAKKTCPPQHPAVR
ncbi:MAG TPA: hypothetical protein VGG74_15290 [Kofleriaceae bacterium]|jgi:hypothetical protein